MDLKNGEELSNGVGWNYVPAEYDEKLHENQAPSNWQLLNHAVSKLAWSGIDFLSRKILEAIEISFESQVPGDVKYLTSFSPAPTGGELFKRF